MPRARSSSYEPVLVTATGSGGPPPRLIKLPGPNFSLMEENSALISGLSWMAFSFVDFFMALFVSSRGLRWVRRLHAVSSRAALGLSCAGEARPVRGAVAEGLREVLFGDL